MPRSPRRPASEPCGAPLLKILTDALGKASVTGMTLAQGAGSECSQIKQTAARQTRGEAEGALRGTGTNPPGKHTSQTPGFHPGPKVSKIKTGGREKGARNDLGHRQREGGASDLSAKMPPTEKRPAGRSASPAGAGSHRAGGGAAARGPRGPPAGCLSSQNGFCFSQRALCPSRL